MISHIYLDKSHKPGEEEILSALGGTSVIWRDIHHYIRQEYDFTSELKFFTKKYGWTLRYMKSKKTMCYFFPTKDCFSILIILGGREAEQVHAIRDRLNRNVLQVFENTEQLHDGRWLWLEIRNSDDISSFKELLAIKKKPGKKQIN